MKIKSVSALLLPALICPAFICLAPVGLAQSPTPASAASAAPAAPAYAAPRTSFGQPNLEGTWTQNFLILMEASPQTPMLTVPEPMAKAMAVQVAAGISKNFDQGLDPEVPGLMAASDGLPIVRGQRRTRSVVEPADGKLPYTPEARKESARGYNYGKFDNPEDRPNWERCIISLGLPPVTGLFTTSANPVQIVQTPGAVVVHTEYGDEARVIPFSGQHKPQAVADLLGDSIAHWEGDTLVVETIYLPETDRVRVFSNLIVPASSKVIERYTRVSEKELLYQYTVLEPGAYKAPWLAEYSLYRTDQRMFEHACHEGNYSLPNILKAERVKEAAAKPAGHN